LQHKKSNFTISTSKKILVVCPYPEGVAAGQRLKYEQYFDSWRKAGFEITVAPFMNHAMWKIVHKKGFVAQKVFYTLLGLAKRTLQLFTLRKYDLVYISMYVNPLGDAFFEKLYRKFSKKIVFDLEDNRMMGASKETSGFAQKIRGVAKTEFLVRESDHVITSSPALNDICKAQNKFQQSTYISSSTDTDKFLPANSYTNANTIVIGWTGTFSTRPYLDLLRPVFLELKKVRDFKLLVIGNFEYSFPEIEMEYIDWTAENEVKDLQKMDIGVYPLPMDDEWVMGKSGLKAIQYMSFGLPAVCSNISTVQNFITHGQNGFLVKTNQDWVETLVQLIDNADLRKKTGQAARETVLQKFSIHKIKEQYLQVLQQTIEV
jgi:L-malate glycosyltransferase